MSVKQDIAMSTTAGALSNSAGVLTLKVSCSSELRHITTSTVTDFIEFVTSEDPGNKYQWSFVIPQKPDPPSLENEPDPPSLENGCSSVDPTPYEGPECCLTVPSHNSSGAEWPDRATSTVPTIFAELLLLGGDFVSKGDLTDLQKNVFGGIEKYFCPKEQVWVSVISRQITDPAPISRAVPG